MIATNRTIVELKQDPKYAQYRVEWATNRTIVELKRQIVRWWLYS